MEEEERTGEEGKGEEGKAGVNQDSVTRHYPPRPQVPFNFILCLTLP